MSVTDGYYWLDSKGILVAHSNTNNTNYLGHIGTYLRFRNHFSIPLGKNIPYYISVINIQKIYISYPIIGSLANTHCKVVKASAKKVSIVGRAILVIIMIQRQLLKHLNYFDMLGRDYRISFLYSWQIIRGLYFSFCNIIRNFIFLNAT